MTSLAAAVEGPARAIAGDLATRQIAADQLAVLLRRQLAVKKNGLERPASCTPSAIASLAKSSYSAPEIIVRATPAEAWAFAVKSALPGELVCIAGSLFLAAELRPVVFGR